ncbi:MAG: hypothetical protein JRM80_10470 [Nitrososphaerota archaeon]|nr:hypothetical protein [Nitrososphaerota archaeon]
MKPVTSDKPVVQIARPSVPTKSSALDPSGKFSIATSYVAVTKIPGSGWHHTEIATEEGSTSRHFTIETKPPGHHYVEPSQIKPSVPSIPGKSSAFDSFSKPIPSAFDSFGKPPNRTETEEEKAARESGYSWCRPSLGIDVYAEEKERLEREPGLRWHIGESLSDSGWAEGYRRVVARNSVMGRTQFKTMNDIVDEWYR